ncbi:SIR2 family protein [Rhizobium leguminosarum bv. viciae 248]|uniref:SIR2 family protein n=1 Tax=Rhizobium leguminosarum TaxID=384 RepID=UPI001398A5B2|nr:SIR2 family protein [Rhizobium leguminosarum]MCA2410537.1 SIR2 family protein [Rhizobium leguminosarum]QHW23483.1 SIR2 family protein [Rhizobium leguminosarum bv. viciae 248]
MRAKIVERLDRTATDLTMHEAILKLARLRGPTDGYRLVTTNFDLFFEQAKAGMSLGVDYHSGPVLPIPRNDQIASWRSIVYLHGRLNPGLENQHLVLTSADFGRAYLTDAWAARFVVRLFAEFTVLFIGYSLNDPVLRYMTDAFAAEDAITRRGQKRSPAYIFVPYPGTVQPDPKPWQQRQLEPIFYRQAYRHRALTKTLVGWAMARTDYLASASTIIRRYGSRLPSALEPSQSSDLVWAVCSRPDDKGHGARIFSQLADPPPIEWLNEFERRDTDVMEAYRKEAERAVKDGREPPLAPQSHMQALFPAATESLKETPLSETSFELAQWLCRHLENERLVTWVLNKLELRRRAHPRLRILIRSRLDRQPTIAAGFAVFWRVVAGEGHWTTNLDSDLPWAGLGRSLPSQIGTKWFDLELVAAARPYLKLRPSYRVSSGTPIDSEDIRTIVDADVILADDDIFYLIDEIDALPAADQIWAEKLNWLTGLLESILELYALVAKADAGNDPTVFSRPSIIPHEQNRRKDGWPRIYDLIWRGWRLVDASSAIESRQWVERWRRVPYLGFRRLVLAAITSSSHFTAQEKLEALLHG